MTSDTKVMRTHPEVLGLQQTLQDLVAAFPLSLLLQDALQENPDLPDRSVCREQIDGLETKQWALFEGLVPTFVGWFILNRSRPL